MVRPTDAPPVYDDLEAGNSAGPSTPYATTNTPFCSNPFHDGFPRSLRSNLPSTSLMSNPILADGVALLHAMKEKPSDRMLSLTAKAATEAERIAAMQAVPQLLAEEEVSRKNIQRENEGLDRELNERYEESRKRSDREWGEKKAFDYEIGVGAYGRRNAGRSVVFYDVVMTPQWKVVQPAAQLVVMAGLLLLFMFLCRKLVCMYN